MEMESMLVVSPDAELYARMYSITQEGHNLLAMASSQEDFYRFRRFNDLTLVIIAGKEPDPQIGQEIRKALLLRGMGDIKIASITPAADESWSHEHLQLTEKTTDQQIKNFILHIK